MKKNFFYHIRDKIIDKHENKYKVQKKELIFLSLNFFGIVFTLITSFYHYFIDHKLFFAYFEWFFAFILLINYIYYLYVKDTNFSSYITFIMYTFLCCGLFISGGFNNLGILWILTFPMVAYFLKGKVGGLIHTIVLISVLFLLLTISHFNLFFGQIPYSYSSFIYILVIMFINTFITFVYEDTLSKSEKAVITQLYQDQLTGLPNRLQLIEDMSSPDEYGLILLNIDDFKTINDLYKSGVGDIVLIELSHRLKSLLDMKNIHNIYKLHADEFAVLIKGTSFKNEIVETAKIIHRNLTYGVIISEVEIVIKISMGIAGGYKNLLSDADMALKLAKEKMENYIYFDPTMRLVEEYESNIEWLKNLERAIALDNIVPYYQPIINNSNGKIEKYECLVRLILNNKEITPNFFLDVAKKAKSYSHITKLMVLKTFEKFKNENYLFSLNISAEDILNDDTTAFIELLIKDYNIGKRVVFEITESDHITNNEKITNFIHNMKALGSEIAIDDFGFGYSNFEYILRMNIDYIKLDASLIKDLLKNKNSEIIAQTIVDFSKKLHIKTIAEHVDTKELLNKVKELSIDYSQGYFIGKPRPNIFKEEELLF